MFKVELTKYDKAFGQLNRNQIQVLVNKCLGRIMGWRADGLGNEKGSGDEESIGSNKEEAKPKLTWKRSVKEKPTKWKILGSRELHKIKKLRGRLKLPKWYRT